MGDLVGQMIEVFHLQLMMQLGLATLCGGAIGFERERSGKPAGLRTNILICLGATLFTSLSVTLSLGRGDPARIAAQVLPGVGFIGAGTILRTRGSVTGLTSAATIWVVAAIGMELGGRAYLEALGTTLVVMLVLWGLGGLEVLVARATTRSRLVVHAKPETAALEDLEAVVRRGGLDIERMASRQEDTDLVIEFELRGPKRLHSEILSSVLHHPSVRAVSTRE